MVRKPGPGDVRIGRFDILATSTSTYVRGLLDGLGDDESGERGMVAAVMGARSRAGHPGGTDDHKADKEATERKKKSPITAESLVEQASGKMGVVFETTFLPAMKRLVEAHLSSEEVKRRLEIPSTRGARTGGAPFVERAGVAKRRGGKA